MTKISAFNIVIKAAATATPTVVIAGLREIGFNGGDRAQIDSTTRDDTVVKSWLPHPLRDVRSLEIVCAYDPADTQHERMRAAHAAITREYQTLILPDTGAAQWALTGYIMKFSLPSLAADGVLEFSYQFIADAAETFTQ